LPIIAKHISNLHFYIVGLNPSDKIKNLESTSVHVTGSVPNLLPYYQRCTACIIPLRAGGGTRLKILEAMAYGRPVVSTSLGCEGLVVEDGKHLLIADSPQEFAEKTILLLTNNDLQQMLINNARELVEQVYDWDIIAQHALHMYEKLHAG
jgi:glycosyltransferase involved in cell wall biosynthesis